MGRRLSTSPPSPIASSEAAGADSSPLEDARERILHVTLVATAVLAGIAYVPGVIASYRAGFPEIILVNTVSYAAVLTLAIGRRLPFHVRAIGLLAICYALAVVLLVRVGPEGAGQVWLASVPVFAAVFFGLAGAIGTLVLLLVTAVGVAMTLGTIQPVSPSGVPLATYDLVSWIATSGSLLFLGAVISVSVGHLLRELGDGVVRERRAHDALSESLAELRREMAERESLEAQLLQSQKMEALGTLAGGIAHDFNNLLVPILTESREIMERLPEGSPDREGLKDVVRSAARARELVRRILAFSRRTDGVRVVVAMEPFLREVVSMLRSTLPRTVRIELVTRGDALAVKADPTELHQVVMNLANNAFLAIGPDGGTLTVELEGRRARTEGAADELILRASDDGVGMDEDTLRRAFEPFFTTRPMGEGTGLGLATVHGIVSQLGGTVHLESEPGRGTTVEIRLPATRALPPIALQTEEPESQSHAAPSRTWILLVDDEPAVRNTAERLLQRMGYLVEAVETPESALIRVIDAPERFSLLLTDHAMPGMSGVALARRIREVAPALPMILVSGYLDAEAMKRAGELSLEGYLEKPFTFPELREAVEAVLRPREPAE
jgi:signal transduction histidine kinase/CheY-like chemotaxis protein